MIHIFFTAVSVLVLTVAIISRGGVPPVTSYDQTEEVLSAVTTSPTPTIESTETPSPTPSTTPIAYTATPSAQPTTPPVSANTDWMYPGSSVVRSVPSLKLESSADPKVITDWYKNQIRALGMNTTSFIVTSTNDKIYNKLVAAHESKKVDIVISRNTAADPVSIEVVTENFD